MTEEKFKYRMATNADTVEIVKLVKNILPEFGLTYDEDVSESDLKDIERTYSNSGGIFYVIENQKKSIIGTVALMRVDSRVCRLRKMYVHPDYRGIGLGRTLVGYAIKKGSRSPL